jgi:hypothetical protein
MPVEAALTGVKLCGCALQFGNGTLRLSGLREGAER